MTEIAEIILKKNKEISELNRSNMFLGKENNKKDKLAQDRLKELVFLRDKVANSKKENDEQRKIIEQNLIGFAYKCKGCGLIRKRRAFLCDLCFKEIENGKYDCEQKLASRDKEWVEKITKIIDLYGIDGELFYNPFFLDKFRLLREKKMFIFEFNKLLTKLKLELINPKWG